MFWYFSTLNLRSYLILTFIISLTSIITESKAEKKKEDVCDLAIVGAGFYGSAAARYASANPGLKICLIGLDEPATKEEYDKRKIYSSHYDASRLLTIIYPQAAFQKLARRTAVAYRNLEQLSGKTLLDPVGTMFVGRENNHLTRGLEDITAAAGTNYEDLSKDLISIRYPYLQVQNGEFGMMDTDGSGLLHCRDTIQAQMQIARQQGCNIISDEVLQVEELKKNYHTIQTAKNGKIKAKRVLFTTGCFAYYSNFTVLPKLDIKVLKQLATLVKVSEQEAKRLITMPAMIYQRDDEDVGNYILPPVKFPDGNYYLKIGSLHYDPGEGLQSLQEVIDWYHAKDKPGELKEMSQRLFELMPDLKYEGLYPKVCVTCETPTLFPYIQRLSPTVTVALVGNGGGASIGDEVGRLATLLSLSGEWDSDVPQSIFKVVLKK